MCSNSQLFLSLNQFSQPHSIGLPNGQTLFITHYGDVQIYASIVLKNVLYVPSFRYNLVSISKLTTQLQTFVLFTDETCLMQDPSLKNKLAFGAIGQRINNLFLFE